MTTKSNQPTVSFSDYKVDITQSITRRISDFLNWYADMAPGRLVSLPDLIKVVRMESRRHNENSDAVTQFKGLLHRATNILEQDYSRSLYYSPGRGVRATTGPDDLAANVMAKRSRRVTLAVAKLKATTELVPIRKIADKELREWARRTKAGAEQLSNMAPNLLPPKSTNKS